ncbi:MAG: 4a-hydroxytetrahydrobiopterin dehydratase [Gammaproteobacteria bacterium]|nr:4a-hydroxytetrahydrobiopterin dehydratase [Gammaproteobacteria bacterium]
MTNLAAKRCHPCRPDEPALGGAEALELLAHLPGWQLNDPATEISRTFPFKNYYQTLAFVNALAWIAHQEDHHPTLTVHYNRCEVRYSTHAVGGLSENDFICATKIDALFEARLK